MPHSPHTHPDAHHPHHAHAPRWAGASLLGASATQRLMVAAGLLAVLWAAVIWALS